MSLEFERKDLSASATLFTVRGRMLVGPRFQELETAVEELSAGPCKHIIVDLSSLAQIDSTGMGLFISAHGKLQKAGGQLRLVGARGAVQDAFHVTRLDTVFAFFPSAEAATSGLE
jgi:anti-anti-sigma factor